VRPGQRQSDRAPLSYPYPHPKSKRRRRQKHAAVVALDGADVVDVGLAQVETFPAAVLFRFVTSVQRRQRGVHVGGGETMDQVERERQHVGEDGQPSGDVVGHADHTMAGRAVCLD